MPDSTTKGPEPSKPAEAAKPEVPATTNQLTPTKTNTGLIIGIIIGAIVLLVGVVIAIVVAFSLLSNDSKKANNKTTGGDSSKQSTSSNEDKLRTANTKTADSLSDFSAVCQTGAVSNAAAYGAPYRVVALAKSSDKNVWSTVSLKYDAPYSVKYSEYAVVNAVVCLTEQKGAAVKAKTCEFKSSGEAKMIDYYATMYDAALYEAKSGKKVKDLGTVSGPAESCPIFVTYDKSDPKIIAKPDSDAVDALVAQFAQ